MKELNGSKKLLYALTGVKDTYIQDAMEFTNNTKKKSLKNVIPFRKAISIVGTIAACFALILVGHHLISINHNAKSGGDSVTVVNPCQEVTELSEAEKLAGFEMKIPKAEKLYSKKVITAIDGNMIEVSYCTADETDEGYYIRKAKDTKDVSGDYSEYAKTEITKVGDDDITLKGNDSRWSVATWNSGKYSYAISCQNHPMTKEKLCELVKKIK